ncbi:jg25662 [Pararge aegeria aegeria]|uniref:Jg25662 protein n=1 Tax=Pararge aegeria aegeria TaxID=348720 RepID=A0A8S4QPV1_9NEOP|nr:jg25662 [Pararge aegeria aegeria]
MGEKARRVQVPHVRQLPLRSSLYTPATLKYVRLCCNTLRANRAGHCSLKIAVKLVMLPVRATDYTRQRDEVALCLDLRNFDELLR